MFLTILVLSSVDALACTCELPLRNLTLKQKVNEARKKSKALFAGQVLEVTANADVQSVVVRFKVQRSWKNLPAKEVSIVTGRGGGDCGYAFSVGETYLVYAYSIASKSLGTNICQRTAKITDVREDLEILGKGREPHKSKP